MSYPYVLFKSAGKTITGTTEVLKAVTAVIVDSIRVGNHEDKDIGVKLYIKKVGCPMVCLNSGSLIKKRDAIELLEGSVLYLEVGDIVKVGVYLGDKGGAFISYREVKNQSKIEAKLLKTEKLII